MSLLKVEASGLQSLAAKGGAWSTDVAIAGVPSVAAASMQATAAAVNAVHVNTGLSGEALSSRLSAAAAHLTTAATAYKAQDGDSATALGALGTASQAVASNSASDGDRGAVQLMGSFKRDGGPSPTPAPPVPQPPAPAAVPFGQCVENEYRKNVAINAVKDGFKSAVTGSALGAVGGGAVLPKGAKPIGALGGGVIGFVGGFARGIATSPAKTLAKAAAECSNIVEELKP